MKLKALLVGASSVALLGVGCGASEVAAPKSQPVKVSRAAGKKQPPPPITEPQPNPVSACTALYSGPSSAANPAHAAVDAELVADGSPQTLILSFNEDDKVPLAAEQVKGLLGVEVGQGLGVFENLPMIAVQVAVTPEVVSRLKATLQPLGLLSIYPDRPLRFFLHQSVALIQADAARTAFQATGKGVGVAVIDSGIDKTHGDFENVVKNVKLVGPLTSTPTGGYLYAELDNTDLPSGHGTHVASIIGGSGARSNGKYKGVAPGASLVGVGTGDGISSLSALQGFDFAMRPEIHQTYNVRILSNSWGTSGRRFDPNDPVSLASKRAYDLGMVVAFAAGNEGPGPDTLNPYSASPCVLSVAAGDKSGALASYSSRGVPGDGFHAPDITAPGSHIVAARASTGSITPPSEGDPEHWLSYSSSSGTSMATPHISGVAALMLEVNPALNLDGVLSILQATATPMSRADGTPLARWEAGAGYVNAFKAIEEAHKRAGSRSVLRTVRFEEWTGSVSAAVEAVVESAHEHTVAVPANSAVVRIRADWSNPLLDLDLFVYGPNGSLVGSSAQAATSSEEVTLAAPAPGSYRVRLEGWLNGPTAYTGTADRDELVQVH